MSKRHYPLLGAECPCDECVDMLAVARKLFERDPELNAMDLKFEMRKFIIKIRGEQAFHAWGANTPGKAATKDDMSPWEENNIRGLEDFDDGAHQ